MNVCTFWLSHFEVHCSISWSDGDMDAILFGPVHCSISNSDLIWWAYRPLLGVHCPISDGDLIKMRSFNDQPLSWIQWTCKWVRRLMMSWTQFEVVSESPSRNHNSCWSRGKVLFRTIIGYLQRRAPSAATHDSILPIESHLIWSACLICCQSRVASHTCGSHSGRLEMFPRPPAMEQWQLSRQTSNMLQHTSSHFLYHDGMSVALLHQLEHHT